MNAGERGNPLQTRPIIGSLIWLWLSWTILLCKALLGATRKVDLVYNPNTLRTKGCVSYSILYILSREHQIFFLNCLSAIITGPFWGVDNRILQIWCSQAKMDRKENTKNHLIKRYNKLWFIMAGWTSSWVSLLTFSLGMRVLHHLRLQKHCSLPWLSSNKFYNTR